MTPPGIEPATFQYVAQHLNHCATAVPRQRELAENYKIFNSEPVSRDQTAIYVRLVWLFGPRRDEVPGKRRRLPNEELNDLYSSPNIEK